MENKNYLTYTLNEDYIKQYPLAFKTVALLDTLLVPELFSKEFFKIDGYAVSFCVKGKCTVSIDFKEYLLRENDIVVLLPNEVIKLLDKSEDFLGYVVFLTNDFTNNLPFPNDYDVLEKAMKFPVISISMQEMDNLVEYYKLIERYYKQINHEDRYDIIRFLVFGLIMRTNSICKTLDDEKLSTNHFRKVEIADGFLSILEKYYRKERNVAFYADQLCVSPKYLSSILKKMTGKSVIGWINQITLSEAKTQLKTSDYTVLEISENLNFANPSSLGKFFKKHTGMTPMEYRNNKLSMN